MWSLQLIIVYQGIVNLKIDLLYIDKLIDSDPIPIIISFFNEDLIHSVMLKWKVWNLPM